MGYCTRFYGEFVLDRPLEPKHKRYLEQFNETRRMKRTFGPGFVAGMHNDVGLPVGFEGEFYVNGGGVMGQDRERSVSDYNEPPSDQPGLWCQWVPNGMGTAIIWDGGEKFYDYVEWLKYIIGNFLAPWGYKLTGTVGWQGERSGDTGRIVVTNKRIYVSAAGITAANIEVTK